MREQQRQSLRLPGFDYTQAGAYFITIVTRARKNIFGQVTNNEVHLYEAGQFAQNEWEKLSIRFPFIELDTYILMPDHIHGIVWLTGRGTRDRSNTASETAPRAPIGGEGTRDPFKDADPLQIPRAPTGEAFGKPISGSLPTIIRSYKSAVSVRLSHLLGIPAGEIWQRNYYEHIIRSEKDLTAIRAYIEANPLQWDQDPENPHG